MKTAVVIPARFASTRFPAKPLAEIAGRPLIRHVVERVLGSTTDRLVVATDDDRIKEAVDGMGCEVFMSDPAHVCGTDRIAEVAAGLDVDFIVNLQGDQLVPPGMIDTIIERIDARMQMATLYADIADPKELTDTNVVKAVVNKIGDIVYMSRCPIPFNRAGEAISYYKQIGIYVFSRKALLEFAALPPSPLESAEGVELLRALDHGIRLSGIHTDAELRDVNIPADIGPAEEFIGRHPLDNLKTARVS